MNYHLQVSEGASRSCQDKIGKCLNPGRWTKVLYHDKFYNVDCLRFLRADARVRVHRTLRICLGCRSKSKNRDKSIKYTVRVSNRALLSHWNILRYFSKTYSLLRCPPVISFSIPSLSMSTINLYADG